MASLRAVVYWLAFLAAPLVGFADGDRIVLPPVAREVKAPGRRYALTVRTTDRWKSARAEAMLEEILPSGGRSQRWVKPLPHIYGPRSIVVSDQGAVAFIDEWMRRAGDFGIMLIDSQGLVVRSIPVRDIQRAALVPAESIGRMSETTWITGEPKLSADGASAIVPFGASKTLYIRLKDGELTVR